MDRRVVRASFRGHRWTVRITACGPGRWGDCDFETRTIRITPSASGQILLDTLIHEGLHASLGDLDHEVLDGVATDLTRMLWRMGWRDSGV